MKIINTRNYFNESTCQNGKNINNLKHSKFWSETKPIKVAQSQSTEQFSFYLQNASQLCQQIFWDWKFSKT